MHISKKYKIIIAAVVCALMMTITVSAAVMLLSPSQIADRLGDSSLSQAFASEDAVIVNESIQTGDYIITFLGMVSGRDISTYLAGTDTSEEYTYAAVSVERADGGEIRQEDGCPVSVTPLVTGYQPWVVNLFSLANGANGYVENNVYYYLFSCNNLEFFADHEIALYAYTGHAPSSEIFSYDAETGEIDYADGYDGVRAVFELELDSSKADPAKVRELLTEAGFMLNEDGSLKLE